MRATDYEWHRFALSPPRRAAMYGLTHRFATTTTLADVTAIGASVTVMAIDRDRLTLTLVREAIAGHYDVVSASDSSEALALIDAHRPDVVLLDMSLEKSDIAMVTMALACDELDSTPVIMIDPEQPMNAVGLRRRIDEAIRVTRRVYLGGGLRHRMAA
jgi:CheY-like chemotaxis protein